MQLDKSYASITLAAMAMHRGFDEHCSVFISPNHMQEVSRKALIVDGAVMDNQLLPIPTLEQIQRWLREKHKIKRLLCLASCRYPSIQRSVDSVYG